MSNNSKPLCPFCGGKGKPGGCSHCGTDSDKSIAVASTANIDKLVNKWVHPLIPEEYLHTDWSKTILLDSHPESSRDTNFIQGINMLEQYLSYFKKGVVPKSSLLLSAPSGYGKSIFMYTCMKYAILNKLSVAPVIDDLELRRMKYFSGQSPTYKLFGWINYEQYIQSDVLFLTITKLDVHTYAYTVIVDLLATRDRLGKSTFIISKWKLQEMALDSRDVDYSTLCAQTGAVISKRKYPNIISFGDDTIEAKKGVKRFG